VYLTYANGEEGGEALRPPLKSATVASGGRYPSNEIDYIVGDGLNVLQDEIIID